MTITKQQRNPRFSRVSTINFRLQERDIEIIKHVYKHRFLNSGHVMALLPGSNQVILKRLQLLYHGQYLDRPKEQIINYRAGAGSSPMIYGLGNKGADLLAQAFKIPRDKVDWTSKNRDVKTVFLDHTLLVAQFMVCLELACRQAKGIKIIEPEEIIAKAPAGTKKKDNPYILRVQAIKTVAGEPRQLSFGLVPDKIFGLHFTLESEGQNRAYFFLEADRATMPIKRRGLARTSYFKKVVGYWAAWRNGIFLKTFNFKNARVLTITKTQDRINNMIKANKEVDERRKGSKMFLFTRISNLNLNNPAIILDKVWQNGRDDELVSLLD